MAFEKYGEFARTYDRLMADMPYPLWLTFAKTCWREAGAEPRSVVDLGCGTGTLSLMLAREGLQVHGIDLSADMLAIAADKTERMIRAGQLPASGAPQWREQDMREWRIAGQADAVVSFCDCLNYLLDERDIVRTFRQTRDGLKDGGVFVCDMLTDHQFASYARQHPFVCNEEDVSYIWTCEYEEQTRIIEHDLTIFAREDPVSPGGGTGGVQKRPRYVKVEEVHTQRAYPVEWVAESLRGAGFSRVAVHADFRMKPPGPRAQRVFFAAVK